VDLDVTNNSEATVMVNIYIFSFKDCTDDGSEMYRTMIKQKAVVLSEFEKEL
jgi:hypothetical protein